MSKRNRKENKAARRKRRELDRIEDLKQIETLSVRNDDGTIDVYDLRPEMRDEWKRLLTQQANKLVVS